MFCNFLKKKSLSLKEMGNMLLEAEDAEFSNQEVLDDNYALSLMLHQDNKELQKVIQNIGCFFISGLVIAQLIAYRKRGKSGRWQLYATDINRIWEEAIKIGAISVEKGSNGEAYSRMVDVSKIINLGLDVLGIKTKVYEIGTDKGGFYGWVLKSPKHQHIDFCIEKISQSGKYPFHFRVVHNKEDKVLFDPWSKGVKRIKHIHTIWFNQQDI